MLEVVAVTVVSVAEGAVVVKHVVAVVAAVVAAAPNCETPVVPNRFEWVTFDGDRKEKGDAMLI